MFIRISNRVCPLHDDFYRRRTEYGHLALCCGSGCCRERHHRDGGGIAAVRRREVHR